MLIGYARVSTQEQTLEPQLQALQAVGVDVRHIYTDVVSGASTERPGLNQALSYLQPGDALVFWKLDRVGRSLGHLITVVRDLQERGIEFKSLTEGFDTTTAGGKLIFNIFGAMAEFEKSLIQERTLAGLAAARARGRNGGRRSVLTPAKKQLLQRMAKDKSLSVRQICAEFGISEATYHRHAKSR